MPTHGGRRATGRGRWAGWVLASTVGVLVETTVGSHAASPAAPIERSLPQCLEMALEKNRTRPASRFAVAAAEAQHRQALSAYWPQISLKGAYEIMDEPRNYIFPAAAYDVPPMTIPLPAQTFSVPGGAIQTPPMMVTIPANAFGPGFPPVNVQLPVAGQTVSVPGQTVTVPAQSFTVPGQSLTLPDQEIKLQDEESWYAALEGQWLLWDGGMRKALRQQAAAGVNAAHEEVRRTDLNLADSVTRLYYGAVMARQVRQVGEDTLARMEATLSLTETMYKEGSGKVKKTDFLDNKVMVESLRAGVALLRKNHELAEAALAYTIGLEWNESVRPADKQIPFEPLPADLQSLVSEAYEFSPDWKRLDAGLLAAEGALDEMKSGHYPKVALTGDLHKWWNDYDKGMATKENKEGWTVRVGAEWPLFQGFLTRNKVKEARARLSKMQEERILLREGLGLQVREVFMGLDAAAKRYQATLDAMTAATENRDLNTRAYQNDLAETEDVIKAQLMEAFMSAQHYKMRYDHAELRSKLNSIVGREVGRRLGGR
jgi:outer membrane protein